MAPVPSLHGRQKGKRRKAVTDVLFMCSGITVNGDCNHEIRRQLLLCSRTVINLDSVKKQRRHLPTKVHIVKAMVM